MGKVNVRLFRNSWGITTGIPREPNVKKFGFPKKNSQSRGKYNEYL
jgi:hypothetical protein